MKENGNVTITGYTNGGDAVIPDMIEGLPVTGIGRLAFASRTITGVTIPSSVTSIDNSTFDGGTGLSSISVSAENPAYADVDGVLFDKSRTTIIAYPAGRPEGNFTIPSSVTSIGNLAFVGCTGLTSVTIPSSVTSIGGSAFANCTGLTSVMIPSGVTSMSRYAFYGCTELTNVIMPSGVISIGDYAFTFCTGLTSVTIPNSVTSIGSFAFSHCTVLTGITIPSGVTSIGGSAFASCTGLTSVTIPAVSPRLVVPRSPAAPG